MKYIITESRLNKFILDWLDDNLTRIDYMSLPRVFFVRDNDGVMFYDKRNGYTSVDGPLIGDDLYYMFNMEPDQIKEIIKLWLTTRHNLEPKIIEIN